MPDAWTHILASNQILKSIENSTYRDVLQEYIKFYQYGSQGPDMFLYYCNLIPSKHKRVKKLSQRLHTDRTGDFIIYCIDKLKGWRDEKEYNILFCYVMGFITHYALDTSVHPFIYYFGGIYHEELPETIKYDHYHRQLEKIIGFIELEKKRGKSGYNVPMYDEINIGKNVPEIINELYFHALRDIYNLEIKKYLINYCYKDMKFGVKFLMEPNAVKNKLFSIAEYIIRKKTKANVYIYPRKLKDKLDYLNKEHRKWTHPCNIREIKQEDMEQLYTYGVEKAINIINLTIKYLEDEISKDELINNIPNLSYESGKPLNQCKRMMYYNCIFE